MKERIVGYVLVMALAGVGGFVAGMMWLANTTPVPMDPISAYCRGNIEGVYMAGNGAPTEEGLDSGENYCAKSIKEGLFDFAKNGYRGPLLP